MSFIESTLYRTMGHSPLQVLTHPLLTEKSITLSVKRDDLLHPDISGNKWRKLKYNLLYAEANNKNHLISFGGAFSNHIHALAAACNHFQFKATGIIRGEQHYASNPTLSQVQKWGMQLQFVDRKTYRLKEEDEYLTMLQKQYPNAYIIPEGGSNNLAIPGVEEVIKELTHQCKQPIGHIFTATGSAGTLAGLISGALKYSPTTVVHGIAVLKNGQYLEETVKGFVQEESQINWHLHTDFHGGGYGKVSLTIAEFCRQFTLDTNIPIEPIYSGKMFYALWNLIEQDYFPAGTHIVALHTGGLQGLAGLKEQKKF
ncbi:1-aminocyclopropane-1-carboxylate deaminase/D-cysteine desulfhydrase [Psychromonas sp. L1A2]|uniref:1-aminocyclopropane-1-carboxylate deaminase/D-cysteine desulfhydrase n=1 Tax=Psychromonas sp. L1A2 TaxID=2686356 RepID=UPI001F300EAA|nr:pyridoxal-phosphate dependent enzyme [Psychromonas sp. L1A2]